MLLLAAALALLQPTATEAVERVATDPAVREAVAFVREDRERAFEDVITISEVPAPPFGEERRAALVRDMLAETGFGETSIDEAGNVLARREGRTGERTIAVLAHIDTVFPEGTDVTVTRNGYTLTGPGIGDNARGVAMLLELARAFEAAGLETEADVLLVGTVGEEGLGDLSGVRHLFSEGADPIHAALVVDGGESARLVTSAVGSNRFRVTYEGPGGHSWGDFGAPNPHHALGRAIALLDERGQAVAEASEAKVSYSVGVLRGGTAVNAIPFESVMLVDTRSGDPQALARMTEAFQGAVQAALDAENEARAPGTQGLTVTVEPVGQRPAGRGDPEASLVRHAVAALERQGIEPELAASSTDANVPLSLGVPAVTMARGGVSTGAHSAEESWTDQDAQAMTEAVLVTLLAEAGY